jgi:hypothetical protein
MEQIIVVIHVVEREVHVVYRTDLVQHRVRHVDLQHMEQIIVADDAVGHEWHVV